MRISFECTFKPMQKYSQMQQVRSKMFVSIEYIMCFLGRSLNHVL